ncbi:NAD(P)-dependent dehydrogenase (short-subunit alcohol dehydrogenase family) [Actinoplanes tereljensis]|uniref:Short-chain dehydrogenase n=1 Tax=Paractinoplanes tereljensis TaxID=571912 RepID=A0A919NHH9_9ACTN|nr:SDR family oxidoreductase [Actinoplanes tereljensis]GIF18283.1 short-chain dehydrogenase [Actinoplanes tereljensis]
MRVVIVTGASSGIGRATAARIGRAGTTVVLAARRADELETNAASIRSAGGEALVVPTDVRDPAAITALVAQAREVTGRIDGLVNNAGVGGVASILADDELVAKLIEVNLMAPIRLMRAVVPLMTEQRSGAIVNIGSVAGEIGISGTYSATKFALRGMTDSVRRELIGTGIGVTLIEPGFIATDLTSNRRGLPGPEIVAAAVERALSRPRRRIVVPLKYRPAITLANTLPALTDRIFAGRAASRREVKGRP